MSHELLSHKKISSIASFIVLGAAWILSLQLAWTGFIASDDGYYVQSGLGWLEQFPYIPQHFGNVRASVSIPIALIFFLFGESEFTATLSTSLFLLATAGITLFMLRNLVGNLAASLACIALVTTPLFALKSTIPCADIPELFFVVLSFWLFWQATSAQKQSALLLASGISAGFAFSAHELTTALILFYGVLFLRAYRIPRRAYLWIALGFTLVILVEGAYYWIFAGNPAHRFMLLFQAAAVHDRVQVGLFQIAAGGTIHIWEPIDPLIMLLTHHEFGLLGWASIPAIWWLLINRSQDQSNPVAFARLALGLGAMWTIVSAVLLRELILLPRYYMLTAYTLLLVCAIWLAIGVRPQRRWLAIGIFSGILFINLLGISLDNKNPRFAEKALVDYLKQSQGPVYTDPLTAYNAHWFCRWAKVDCTRLVTDVPKANAAYFWNPKNTSKPNRFLKSSDLPAYQPKPSWEKRWTQEEAPHRIATLLKHLGLSDNVPTVLWDKLSRSNSRVYIFVVN